MPPTAPSSTATRSPTPRPRRRTASPPEAWWRAAIEAVSHLPPLHVSAERESEIVEELAIQLEATFERAKSEGEPDDRAMTRALARELFE